jgi:uncharacterized metal-binding protein YceD (DUF177 family)
MNSEFSHRLPLVQVPAGGRDLRLEATSAERDSLSRRFGLLGLQDFTAELTLVPDVEGAIQVRGRMRAELDQECGITLVPVHQSVDEPVAWRLLPEGMEPSDGEDDPDDIESEQGAADLGEALAQQLSLAIDPIRAPRVPSSPRGSATRRRMAPLLPC